jgi:hypothetical protein
VHVQERVDAGYGSLAVLTGGKDEYVAVKDVSYEQGEEDETHSSVHLHSGVTACNKSAVSPSVEFVDSQLV